MSEISLFMWWLIKIPLSANGSSSRIKNSFANSMYLSRNPCWATTPLMKIHSSPANHKKLSRITSSLPCKHAASITESPSQDRLLLMRQFFARLTAPLSQNALWLSPTLSQNFREISLSADPSHQQGAHQRGKKESGSLAAAFGACFLRLQKVTLGSTSGRCKDVLQDHGIWLTFGSLAATYGAVPFSCRTPGGP